MWAHAPLFKWLTRHIHNFSSCAFEMEYVEKLISDLLRKHNDFMSCLKLKQMAITIMCCPENIFHGETHTLDSDMSCT